MTKIVRIQAILLLAITAQAGCKRAESRDRSSPATQPQRQLNVAAAADLKFALDEVAAAFKQNHQDVTLQITYGSSGNFYSQLVNKAPFDLFLSADAAYVDKLIASGFADKDSKFLYAIGRIALWVPNDSPLDVSKRELEALLDPSVKKIAIANPQHAPYGRAAEAALRAHGLWDKVQGKLVLGENIAQTAQFVQSGSVDAGMIALSLAMSPNMKDAGRYYVIPPADYPRLEQAGATLSSGQDRPAADAFRQFLTGPDGRRILARYGFGLPQ